MDTLGKERVVQVNDVEIVFGELGDGPPLVMLHGLADTHRTFRRVAAALAKSHRVLLPDLPGHGRSRCAEDAPFTARWYADSIAAWMDAIGVERAALCGHSLGGAIALSMLRPHPSKVSKLALVAPGGLGREVSWWLRAGCTSFAQTVLASTALRRALTLLAVHYGPAHFAKPEPDELETHALLAAHPEVAAAVSRTIAACLDANGQRATFWDEEHVVELLPPLAVFWGELDAVVPFVHCTEAMERLVGAQMHVYPSSGHFPHLDEPERFARELADFLVTADVPRCRVLPPPCRDAIVESPILTQPGEAQPPLLSAAPSSGPISIASITEWLGGWIWRDPITSEKEITSGKECAARG